MAFITWQQILIFQLGYRVSRLKDELVNEEVFRQELIRDAHSKLSISSVSNSARNQLGMRTPGNSDTDILILPLKKSNPKENNSINLLAFFKEFLAPPPAQAK